MSIEAFYRIFMDISTSVHSSTDVKEVLNLVVRKSTEAINAKGSLLRILNLETNQLELSAAYGLSERYLSKGHVSRQKVITDLCTQNKVIIIDDVRNNSRVQYPREAKEEGIEMMLDVPLYLGNHVVGIIRIFLDHRRRFSEEELNFLVSIAEQCACAIEKARLIEKHKSLYDHLALHTEKLSALGRMAAGIAHEINNPLAGILLYSTNLIKKIPEEGALREGLEVIIHETIRCRSVIQELLEFSREKEPQKTLAHINEIMERTLRILENEFQIRRISVEKHLKEPMPKSLVDVNQMQQVFVNLLINAAEAVQEHGAITILTDMDADGRALRIEISDTGSGISKEHMARIFEPFFSTKPKGTGLGLAVSYGIVKNHQGDIRVQNDPGGGARFTITIPLAPESAADTREGGDHEAP